MTGRRSGSDDSAVENMTTVIGGQGETYDYQGFEQGVCKFLHLDITQDVGKTETLRLFGFFLLLGRS